MAESFSYKPVNVCAQGFEFIIDGDTITSVKITRGCAGNTQGVARLAEGRKIDEVISLLKGIKCPGSKGMCTSCPDQIALALEEYKRTHQNG